MKRCVRTQLQNPDMGVVTAGRVYPRFLFLSMPRSPLDRLMKVSLPDHCDYVIWQEMLTCYTEAVRTDSQFNGLAESTGYPCFAWAHVGMRHISPLADYAQAGSMEQS